MLHEKKVTSALLHTAPASGLLITSQAGMAAPQYGAASLQQAPGVGRAVLIGREGSRPSIGREFSF